MGAKSMKSLKKDSFFLKREDFMGTSRHFFMPTAHDEARDLLLSHTSFHTFLKQSMPLKTPPGKVRDLVSPATVGGGSSLPMSSTKKRKIVEESDDEDEEKKINPKNEEQDEKEDPNPNPNDPDPNATEDTTIVEEEEEETDEDVDDEVVIEGEGKDVVPGTKPNKKEKKVRQHDTPNEYIHPLTEPRTPL